MNHRAFSLLEMMVVMLIVGTMATIAAPRFAAAVDRYQADAAPQRIVAEFERAAATARAQRRLVTLTFDLDADTVSSNEVASLRGAYETYELRLEEAPYRATIVAADFGGAQRIQFDGFGEVVEAGSLTIRAGGHTRVISISSDGETTISDPDDDEGAIG